MEKIKAFQIDLARQKETCEEVLRMFDLAARFGYNTVVLYLEDRIKTDSYPYSDDIDSYSVSEAEGFVEYASKLGIELIPVVSNFGHVERFLRHDQLKGLAELRGGREDRFGSHPDMLHDACPSLEETYEFFDKYISEIAAIFPSKYFHVGLDEMFNIGLCELCAKREGGISGIFADHINRTHALLASLGKRMMMWEDMFEMCPDALEKIPTDVVMCVWNYDHVGRYFSGHFNGSLKEDLFEKFISRGFDVLACCHCNMSNMDSYLSYAERYETLGTLVTIWECSAEQTAHFFPFLAYGGLLMQGAPRGIGTLEKAVGMLFPDTDGLFLTAAANVLRLRFNERSRYICDPDVFAELDRKDMTGLASYECAFEMLDKTAPEEYRDDPTLLSIKDDAIRDFIRIRTQLLHGELSDHELGIKKTDTAALSQKISALRGEIESIYGTEKKIWKIIRGDMPSPDLDAEYTKQINFLGDLEKRALSAVFGGSSALIVTLFISDPVNIPSSSVTLYYADGTEHKVYDGCYKQYDLKGKESAYLTLRFKVPDKAPARCLVEGYGYGGVCVSYVECLINGAPVRPAAALLPSGRVSGEQRLLVNDSTWCMFGEPDMKRCVREPYVTKQRHKVELIFEER